MKNLGILFILGAASAGFYYYHKQKKQKELLENIENQYSILPYPNEMTA